MKRTREMNARRFQGGDFSERLAAVMERLNYSRVALAREMTIDKAAVSRWLAGENRPTEHNLTRLTELVRRVLPNFSLMDWQGSSERFATALEAIDSSAPEPAPARMVIRGLQTPPAPRRWQRYLGLWAGFYSSLLNDGAILLWIMRVYSDELGMRFQTSFGALGGEGPALIAGGRLHLLTEVTPLHDRIAYFVFNAVHAPRADLLDGLVAVPAGDVDGTPAATLLRAVRIGDGSDESSSDMEFLGEKVRLHNRAILRAIKGGLSPLEAVSELASPALVVRVVPRVGVAQANGEFDHVLRMRTGGQPPRALIEAAQGTMRSAFGLIGHARVPASVAS